MLYIRFQLFKLSPSSSIYNDTRAEKLRRNNQTELAGSTLSLVFFNFDVQKWVLFDFYTYRCYEGISRILEDLSNLLDKKKEKEKFCLKIKSIFKLFLKW